MSKKPTVIGSKILISFPTLGVQGVSAKVDTGADSSSIWATNIKEKDGQLEFVLFGPSSPYFTGKKYVVTEYELTSVKNSFGHTQYRYKVALPVVIEGRRIRAFFTLADRGNSTHAILLGRRTLKGKFIVDVSHKHQTPTKRRLLYVSTKKTQTSRKFLDDVERSVKDLEITYATYDDLLFLVGDGEARIELAETQEDIATYDIIHFKVSSGSDVAATAAQYALSRGCKVIDGESLKHHAASSKLYQYFMLVRSGIPVPRSIYVTPATLHRAADMYERFAQELGVPFILKDIHGNVGRNNEVIHNQGEMKDMISRIAPKEVHLIAQKMIPNEGDYRVLVMGQQIRLVMWRSRKDDSTHLNNTSQGATAELRSSSVLPAKVKTDSLRSAKIMGRNIVGVDMVQDARNGQWYCFEVNDGPQIVKGEFLDEKKKAYQQYIERELEK